MNLREEDVHVEAAGKARYGWLHVRSGKSRNVRRNIRMTGRVSSALAPRLKDPSSPGLFPGDSPGRPLLVTSLAHAHIRVCRPESGKKRRYPFPKEFVLHSCRHTLLTGIGEAGVDAFTIPNASRVQCRPTHLCRYSPQNSPQSEARCLAGGVLSSEQY